MNYKLIQEKNQRIIKKLNKKVRLYWSFDQEQARRNNFDRKHVVLWAENKGNRTYFSEQCCFPNKTSSVWKDMKYLGVFLECQLSYKRL